jgi:uncharacterized protein (TIGR03067 family)
MEHAMKCIVPLFCLASFAFAGAGDDLDKTDLKNMQGIWKVILAESKGERVPFGDIQELLIVIDGSRGLVREDGKTQDVFRFEIDSAKKPKHINFIYTEGQKKGRTDKGIYLLERDSLRFCIDQDKEKGRPGKFDTQPGTDLFLVVLQRIK